MYVPNLCGSLINLEVQIPQEEAIINSHNVKGTNHKFPMLPTTHSFHKDFKREREKKKARAK